MEHFVLIDGHHLMYRAYYAIPRTMRTRLGEQTNAVFGVASMLLAILEREKPSHLLFCFDAGEETFRHTEMAAYKEGRAETPEEFYLQIPRILELIETFPFRHVSDKTFEADDFLGTYARAAEREGMRVTIVTGDRDAFQLASERVRIAIPHKGYREAEYLGPQEILQKYGVRPDQIPSYKGLTGDSSDNLPGVRGIGPKGAAELLSKYETLEGVFAHLPELKESLRAKLERDREQAFFCERFSRLVLDIALPMKVASCIVSGITLERSLALFEELAFTVLVRRLRSLAESPYGKERLSLGGLVSEPMALGKKQKDQMALF